MDQKKKILIFSTTYHPFVGGAEVAIKEITDRLGNDIEFDMVTLRFDSKLPKFEKVGNINIHRIGFVSDSPNMSDLVKFPLKLNKYLFPFIAWWKAGDLHSERRYNAIWAMMAAFAGFGAMFFKSSHPEVSYLLTLQEGDPIPTIKKKVKPVYFLFKKIFTKADFVQVISNYLGDWARDMGCKTIEVIPNAVDTKIFTKSISPIKPKEKILITTSRLVEKNAIDDVVKSLKYLDKNINFFVLGNGPDEDKLKKLAEIEGVDGRVKFLGSIDYKEIPDYLYKSDIFIRPSLSEGFGNSFIEAMAAEVPVIATEVGGIPDFLKDGETGLFVNVRDPKDIAEKVKILLKNEELRENIIKNAKKMVEEKYDWDIIAKDMKEKVFDRLI